MPTLTTRLGTYGKGSALSHAEMDANWKRPVTSVTSTPLTLTEAHNRNIIECGTGSGTLALTAAATLAAIDTEDWFVDIVNTTSSAITIDPNGSETIDGATTYTIAPEGSVRVFLNAAKTGFRTFGTQTDVITTRGDLVRGSSSNVAERLPIGTAGYFFRSDGTDAAWATPYHAALAYRVANLTHSSSASYIDIPLTSDSYDSGTIHDGGGANPELFTAPSWATKARFIAQVEFDSNTTGNRVLRIVTSAGATLTPGVKCAYAPNASGVTLQLVSPIVPVTGGTSYKLQAYQNSGGSITIYGPDTYMFVEFFP